MENCEKPDFLLTLLPSGTASAEQTLAFFQPQGTHVLGRGGQGAVLSVCDGLGARCAMKLFASRAAAEHEWRALVANRAERVVPEPLFFGYLDAMPPAYEGSPWAVVMEEVPGVTLGELIARLGGEGEGPAFTYERAMRIMGPVIAFCAHVDQASSRAPLVHRDINPANIMVNEETGDVRIVDFGISTAAASTGAFDGLAPAPRAEAAAKPLGTAGFSAPELCCPQEAGEPCDLADSRVDTYSLAAVMFALLGGTGNPPAYGQPLDPALEFTHEQGFLDAAVAQLRDSLARSYGLEIAANLAHEQVLHGTRLIDARVRACLAACLSTRQASRPLPSDLASMIPLSRESYANELHLIASVSCLGGGKRFSQGFDLEEEVQADRSVLEALDEFNSGRYDRAARIFEKRARGGAGSQGALSCLYYLGVMIRDGYAPALREFTLADVAFYFTQAAKAGNVLAQNALGQMLYEGFAAGDGGFIQDAERGLAWIRQSAADDPASGKVGFVFARQYLERIGAQEAERN